MKYMNRILALLGAGLFVAPFLFSYTGNTAALWTCLILGVLIAVLGYLKSYRWTAGLGAITLVGPFILGFGQVTAAVWTCMIVGFLVATLAGYQGWLTETADSGTTQHGRA